MPADTRARRILLADADAFFVAVARLVDPEGAGRQPFLIVGGTPDGRGVVTSASYEARAFGVRSAMPTAKALRLCPQAVVAPVPRNECVRMSRKILMVLRRFTPVVEPASIDEFYLDMTGTERLYRGEPLHESAARMREAVRHETGLTVSIGGGTSKLIAKLAAKIAKPRPERGGDGVHVVLAGSEEAFMRQLHLADIPMIGPRFQERLGRFGLERVEDVVRVELDTLRQWLGKREGLWLYHRVRGRDVATVTAGYKRKSLGHEETFRHDLETDEELERELIRLVVHVAADLRSKYLGGRTITLKLRDYDFETRSAACTLPTPIATDRPMLETARDLLRKLRNDRRVPARLLGVSISHLSLETEAGPEQLDLFDAGDAEPTGLETPRDRTLARAVDDISNRFGRKGIVRAVNVR